MQNKKNRVFLFVISLLLINIAAPNFFENGEFILELEDPVELRPLEAENSLISINEEYLFSFGTQGGADGQFQQVTNQAINSSGYIYVADSKNHRVQIFHPNGTFLGKFGSFGTADGLFDTPEGIAVNGSDYIYVSDSKNHRVQIFSLDGTFLGKFGTYGTGVGQFNWPSGLAVNSSGYVYVTDRFNHRVQIFSPNGMFVRSFGSSGTGDGQFIEEQIIAINSTGDVYVADTHNHRIQVFSQTGVFLTKFGTYGTGDGQFHYPSGIAFNKDGFIYTSDLENDRIQIFYPNGTFVYKFGSLGTGIGQFNQPSSIVVNKTGQMYVTDMSNFRIQVFKVNIEGFAPLITLNENGLDSEGILWSKLTFFNVTCPEGEYYDKYQISLPIEKGNMTGGYARLFRSTGSEYEIIPYYIENFNETHFMLWWKYTASDMNEPLQQYVLCSGNDSAFLNLYTAQDIFPFYDDFESYTENSDINGQGDWTTLHIGIDGHAKIIESENKKMLGLKTTVTNEWTGVVHPFLINSQDRMQMDIVIYGVAFTAEALFGYCDGVQDANPGLMDVGYCGTIANGYNTRNNIMRYHAGTGLTEFTTYPKTYSTGDMSYVSLIWTDNTTMNFKLVENTSVQCEGTDHTLTTFNHIYLGSLGNYNIDSIKIRQFSRIKPTVQLKEKSYIPDPPAAPLVNEITPNPSLTGNISVTWNIIEGATSYRIYRDLTSITSIEGLMCIAEPTTSSWTDLGLSNDTYHYVVTAVNESGESDPSNCVNVTVAIPSLPEYLPQPPNLQPISPNPSITGNITLDWNDIPGVTGYYVYRDTTTIANIFGRTPIATITESGYIDTELSNGTYHYVVVANNASGNSSMSNVQIVTVTITPSATNLEDDWVTPTNFIIQIDANITLPIKVNHIDIIWLEPIVQNAQNLTFYIATTRYTALELHTGQIPTFLVAVTFSAEQFVGLTPGEINRYRFSGLENGTYYVCMAYANPLGTAFSNVLEFIVEIESEKPKDKTGWGPSRFASSR
jgi:sugar lactone lactonase YvrE